MRMPIFNFTNKDAPDYCPRYGNTYTARQIDIINCDIPLDNVRANEIMLIRNKAQQLGDFDTYDVAGELYRAKTTKNEYIPIYTADEAKAILQSLTPWKINW